MTFVFIVFEEPIKFELPLRVAPGGIKKLKCPDAEKSAVLLLLCFFTVSEAFPWQLKCLARVYGSTPGADVYGGTDQSGFIADVCIVMMVLNNATALPFPFHIIYCAYRPRLVECFQLL